MTERRSQRVAPDSTIGVWPLGAQVRLIVGRKEMPDSSKKPIIALNFSPFF